MRAQGHPHRIQSFQLQLHHYRKRGSGLIACCWLVAFSLFLPASAHAANSQNANFSPNPPPIHLFFGDNAVADDADWVSNDLICVVMNVIQSMDSFSNSKHADALIFEWLFSRSTYDDVTVNFPSNKARPSKGGIRSDRTCRAVWLQRLHVMGFFPLLFAGKSPKINLNGLRSGFPVSV